MKNNHSWDLSGLFNSDNDPEIEQAQNRTDSAVTAFSKKWENRDDYLGEPQLLKTVLSEYNELVRDHFGGGKTMYYFWLRSQVEQSSPKVKARYNELSERTAKWSNKVQFLEIKLSKLSASRQKSLLVSPELNPYRYFLSRIFDTSKFKLSQDKEEMITLKHATSHDKWVDMVEELLSSETAKVSDESGVAAERSFEEIVSLMNSQNKHVRDEAAAVFNEINQRHSTVATHELNAILANKKTDDEQRGYSRPDQERHLQDAIPTGTVDTLINTVSENNDVSRRFYALKSKLLGYEKLQYHERNIEYGSIDTAYSYEAGAVLVKNVLSGLDTEFEVIFDKFIKNRQIDVFPRPNKRGGAFCTHWSHSLPTFICLNYTGKLSDVTTLAHEVGHGIHNELMRKKQPPLYFSTSLATAEVASQYLEDFVLEEISSHADEETKLAIKMSRLNDNISAVFRQAACYRFEQDLHNVFRKNGFISRDEIGAMFSSHMEGYMGDAVERSKGSENWWVYWSHIRVFFYVYSYVSGLLIAKSLQRNTRQDPVFTTKVKDFLAAGSSMDTTSIFKELGIDISKSSFWQDGIDTIKQELDEVETLARNLGKL